MPEIQILSPHLADLIAAGEVVERPASVVKELVENAFDAGARTVTVELRGGGATYLRVTDDGCGMAPEDAGIAFLRHATSKLHDEQGLEAIGTMGFRGEALAAISAVSHITLTTRQRGAAAGTHMTLDAGDIQDMYETGCPEGTTMIVRDLFFNTPARRKFLKSDRAEGAACAAAALRCALGRPDVSVRCIRDGEEVFFSPGDNKLDSCVYSLLGRDLAMSLLPCTGEADGVRVHGFISSPAAGRGSRAQQYFFCNGRWIRSAALQAALEQAYRNTLLVGRFPACVLYVELSCAAVDVNVHPAKTEVKFTHERAVFDAVYYGARAALEAEKAPVTTLSKTAAKPEPAPKADPFVPSTPKAAPAAAQHPFAPAAPAFAPARTYAPAAPAEEAVAFRSPTASAFAAPRVAPPPVFVTPARPIPSTPPAPEPIVPVARPSSRRARRSSSSTSTRRTSASILTACGRALPTSRRRRCSSRCPSRRTRAMPTCCSSTATCSRSSASRSSRSAATTTFSAACPRSSTRRTPCPRSRRSARSCAMVRRWTRSPCATRCSRPWRARQPSRPAGRPSPRSCCVWRMQCAPVR